MSVFAHLLQATAQFGSAAVAHRAGQQPAKMKGSHAECTPCAANAYVQGVRRTLSGQPPEQPARKARRR